MRRNDNMSRWKIHNVCMRSSSTRSEASRGNESSKVEKEKGQTGE